MVKSQIFNKDTTAESRKQRRIILRLLWEKEWWEPIILRG